MRNYNVLLLGGDMAQQEAIAKLSFLGKASTVVALNKDGTRTEFERYQTGTPNVFEPDDSLREELRKLNHRMDLIIDFEYPSNNFKLIHSCLKETGRLVCHRQTESKSRYNFLSNIREMIEDAKLSSMEQAFVFDYDIYCEKNYAEVLRDQEFLLRLLSMRKLRPHITKYIPGHEATIQRETYGAHVNGEVICELR